MRDSRYRVTPSTRYLPATVGAWYVGEGRCRFRVWAPTAQSVEVHLLTPPSASSPWPGEGAAIMRCRRRC